MPNDSENEPRRGSSIFKAHHLLVFVLVIAAIVILAESAWGDLIFYGFGIVLASLGLLIWAVRRISSGHFADCEAVEFRIAYALAGLTIGAAAAYLHPGPPREHVVVAGNIVVAIWIFWPPAVEWLSRRKQFGDMLVKPHEPRGCFVLASCMLGLVIVGDIWDLVDPSNDDTPHLVARAASTFLSVSFVTCCLLFFASRNIEIRERGCCSFFPTQHWEWDSIASYEWLMATERLVKLRLNLGDVSVVSPTLLIYATDKEAVDAVLEPRVTRLERDAPSEEMQ